MKENKISDILKLKITMTGIAFAFTFYFIRPSFLKELTNSELIINLLSGSSTSLSMLFLLAFTLVGIYLHKLDLGEKKEKYLTGFNILFYLSMILMLVILAITSVLALLLLFLAENTISNLIVKIFAVLVLLIVIVLICKWRKIKNK